MLKITLAAARVNAGLTQEEVAKKLKKSKTTINAWEKGRSMIDFSNLAMLSEIYNIPVDNLFLPNRQSFF